MSVKIVLMQFHCCSSKSSDATIQASSRLSFALSPHVNEATGHSFEQLTEVKSTGVTCLGYIARWTSWKTEDYLQNGSKGYLCT